MFAVLALKVRYPSGYDNPFASYQPGQLLKEYTCIHASG